MNDHMKNHIDTVFEKDISRYIQEPGVYSVMPLGNADSSYVVETGRVLAGRFESVTDESMDTIQWKLDSKNHTPPKLLMSPSLVQELAKTA